MTNLTKTVETTNSKNLLYDVISFENEISHFVLTFENFKKVELSYSEMIEAYKKNGMIESGWMPTSLFLTSKGCDNRQPVEFNYDHEGSLDILQIVDIIDPTLLKFKIFS